MGRTVGSMGAKTMEAIAQAGLDLVYQFGYEGMTLRQLAARVGIRQGSLYNHIKSKQDLLVHLYRRHMETLLAALDAALGGIEFPPEQLRAFVDFHVAYHVERKREVFVVNSELRSLEPTNHTAATDLRRQYERRLIAIMRQAPPKEPSRSPMRPGPLTGSWGCCRGSARGTIPRPRGPRASLGNIRRDDYEKRSQEPR